MRFGILGSNTMSWANGGGAVEAARAAEAAGFESFWTVEHVGSVPIVISGHSRAAAERAGRLGDGFFPGKGTVAEVAEMVDIVRQTAAAADRDPSLVEVSAGAPGIFGDDPAAAVDEMAAVGVSRIMVPAFRLTKPGAMDAFADRMLRTVGATAGP